MTWLRIAITAIINLSILHADDFALKSPTGSTVVTVHTVLTREGKGPRLVATARNASGLPIDHAKVCIHLRARNESCLFTFWNTEEWPPDAVLNWELTSDLKVADLSHEATLLEFELKPGARVPTKFDPVQKVFVDKFGGNTGARFRDHVIGMLANRGRFTAVENRNLSDAVIRGRSDSTEQATKVTSEGKTVDRGGAAAIGGAVFTSGKGSSVSQSLSQAVIGETISLRLTTPSGEVIWAWDETKPCTVDAARPELASAAKAKCAVQDLTVAARK